MLAGAYLDVTRPPVQVHVQVLNGAKLAKHVVKVLLGRLFVHIGDDDDPALDGAHSYCAGFGQRVARLGAGSWRIARRVFGRVTDLVNVHLGVVLHGCVSRCGGYLVWMWMWMWLWLCESARVGCRLFCSSFLSLSPKVARPGAACARPSGRAAPRPTRPKLHTCYRRSFQLQARAGRRAQVRHAHPAPAHPMAPFSTPNGKAGRRTIKSTLHRPLPLASS